MKVQDPRTINFTVSVWSRMLYCHVKHASKRITFPRPLARKKETKVTVRMWIYKVSLNRFNMKQDHMIHFQVKCRQLFPSHQQWCNNSLTPADVHVEMFLSVDKFNIETYTHRVLYIRMNCSVWRSEKEKIINDWWKKARCWKLLAWSVDWFFFSPFYSYYFDVIWSIESFEYLLEWIVEEDWFHRWKQSTSRELF